MSELSEESEIMTLLSRNSKGLSPRSRLKFPCPKRLHLCTVPSPLYFPVLPISLLCLLPTLPPYTASSAFAAYGSSSIAAIFLPQDLCTCSFV